MTKEDKELLLRDLCGRLPYGVKCRYQYIQYIENGIMIDIKKYGIVNIDGHIKDICDIKPYLFPLSSMTEEQRIEYDYLHNIIFSCYEDGLCEAFAKVQEFYHKNHLDYRDLIKKGSAIDATGLNIY